MNTTNSAAKRKKWLYPLVYCLFVVISFLPLYTEKSYSPENTQDVILNLLMSSTQPFKRWGIVFHVLTLAIIVLIAAKPKRANQVFAAYFGINFIIIAFVQSIGITEKYGRVIHTGGMITFLILGFIWVRAAIRGDLETSFDHIKWPLLCLFPFALLAFWAPYSIQGSSIVPDFNPLLLITSPDYGLTFCFTTPVFLFLLSLFYPRIPIFAYRVTAFNGLLYALFNLTHWFHPETRWMGFLHIPLLVTSLFALIQSTGKR
jgi:drug/metabolite transporter superfamily protein YnfA